MSTMSVSSGLDTAIPAVAPNRSEVSVNATSSLQRPRIRSVSATASSADAQPAATNANSSLPTRATSTPSFRRAANRRASATR